MNVLERYKDCVGEYLFEIWETCSGEVDGVMRTSGWYQANRINPGHNRWMQFGVTRQNFASDMDYP